MSSSIVSFSRRVLAAAMVVSAFSLSAAACGGDEETTGIAFHGEAPALPGFSYDTGLIPASSPAQVSLKLSAGGNILVDAQGVASEGKIAGKPGTGRAKLDVHVKLEGRLKVDTALKKYDGEIPGLSNIDIPIVAETPFDPFLLDGKAATVAADVPETKLPDIPLGSVPGNLQLTIVAGSKLTAKYTGGCMAVANGEAKHSGSAVIGGTLVMKGAIQLDLPAPLNKTIELAEFTVPIPEATRPVPFGPVAVSVADGNEGPTCDKPVVPGDLDGGVISEDGAVVLPDGAVCSASNCAGCCRDGVCLSGQTSRACGKTGEACESCSGSTVCQARACVEVNCGPSNCAGCCQNNVCISGTMASSCGLGGAACAPCGVGTICDGVSCVNATCRSSCASGCCTGSTCNPGNSNTACGKSGDACIACSAGKTCTAGSCAVAGTARYDLLLFSATIPLANQSNGAWDAFNGLPDPFAKLVSVEGASRHEGQTATLNDTRFPNWNQVVLANVAVSELKSSLRIDVFDDDVAVDDTIGGCAIPLTDASFDGTLRTGTCAASATGVAFTFTYRLLAR